MSHFPDERTLQRCVDGELSEAEHQALLRELERHPAAWRDVALAFIEQQLWTQGGRDFVHTPPLPQPLAEATGTNRSSPRRWLHHTALAASTLMAIGLGYMGGTQKFRSSGQELAGKKTPEVNHPGDSLHPRAIPAQLTSSSNDIASQLQPWPQNSNWLPPRLSDEDRQRLKDEGYQIIEEPQYYSVPIENNRHLVVPVNTIHLQQPLQ